MTAMFDVLQTFGMDVNVANQFCVDVIHTAMKPTLIEAYGIGNIMEIANGKLRNLNVDGFDAFDFKTTRNLCFFDTQVRMQLNVMISLQYSATTF